MATRISLSVYNHLKQYKNQFKELSNMRASVADRLKDTTQSELQYLFTYKMQVFEKKYYENVNKQYKEF